VIAAAHEPLEEFLGLVLDAVTRLAHVQAGGVKVVFAAGDPQRLLAGVLTHQIRQAFVEAIDFRLGEGGRLAMTPDRMLAQKQLAERLNHALDHLPFDQRTAIILREIDGLSYEEIAFSLGVAIGTVKSRLTRARQALRLELREERTA
jgi:RNA polymerase sigma factor (sigma-70 family)